eukprot:TRINITY_DN35870_c0_g1_i1.p1 TRINITY_DN35870_c0_g1~~TRINITY_DN35870_c0_g1_i1.p1  ORF type:complete len:288 (-),score=37.40 TRINITY_DN35870_c0_g1_i1:41-904(-)
MDTSSVLWKTKEVLHGKNNNVVLPALLVTAATILVVYCHHQNPEAGDPTKHFLALVVIQMLPLVFLEVRIMKCPDPLSMLSQFGTKVLLMHTTFLLLRVGSWPFLEVGMGFCNIAGLIGAVLALVIGFDFRPSVQQLIRQLDVIALISLAAVGAFVSEFLDTNRVGPIIEGVIFSSSNFIEILSFVPAVWMVHKTSGKKHDDGIMPGSSGAMKQGQAFFVFLVGFYIAEDVLSAISMWRSEPLVTAGHAVHFLLILDFSCFILSHIYNPDKTQSPLLRWFIPEQLMV